jgi:hypothetical protein
MKKLVTIMCPLCDASTVIEKDPSHTTCSQHVCPTAGRTVWLLNVDGHTDPLTETQFDRLFVRDDNGSFRSRAMIGA